MGADALNTILQQLLAAGIDALDPALTGNPEPERVYISHGEPAWDLCEQDTLVAFHGPVRSEQIAGGNPCQLLPSSTFCLELIRCVPTMSDQGVAPPPEDLTESAEGLNRDVWSILTGLYALLPDLGCENIDLGLGDVLGPLGGVAGWRVCLDISINEPGPTPGS